MAQQGTGSVMANSISFCSSPGLAIKSFLCIIWKIKLDPNVPQNDILPDKQYIQNIKMPLALLVVTPLTDIQPPLSSTFISTSSNLFFLKNIFGVTHVCQ